MDTFPVLYILMRNDLPSMNPGKAMAQASHSSNAFVKAMTDSFLDSEGVPNTPVQTLFNEWQLETNQGFGTVLVLAVTETQMRTATDIAKMIGFQSEIVNDPTYPAHLDAEAAKMISSEKWTMDPIPVGDKMVTFRSEDTCAYIFGNKNDPMLNAIVGKFPLHP